MASVSNKQTQAEYEETLKATIISQARALYGPNHAKHSTLDVITSAETKGIDVTAYVSWLIVYPDNSSTPHGNWKPLLRTFRKHNVQTTYEKLIFTLRTKMVEVMRNTSQTGVETETHEEYGDMYSDPWE